MRSQPTRRRTQAPTVTLAKRMLTILCAVLLVFSTPLQSLAQDSAATGEVVAATSDSTEDATASEDTADDADSSDSTDDADSINESSANADDASTDTNTADATGTGAAATPASTPVLLAIYSGTEEGTNGGTWFWSLNTTTGLLEIWGSGITKSNPNATDGSAWPWYQYRDEITTVEIYGYAGSDLSYMFDGLTKLTRVYSNGIFNLTTGPDMSYMFRNCTSLTTIDGGTYWTANLTVTNIEGMFYNCSSLTDSSALVVGYMGISTTTTNMSYLFYGCSSLTDAVVTSLSALESWSRRTSSVTNMSYMFANCTSLTSPDFSDWNTSAVTNMQGMFSGCTSLSDAGINQIVSSLTVSAVTNMSYMFRGCTSLTSPSLSSLSSWDTSKVTNMSYMFQNCTNLRSPSGLSNLITSAATSMEGMFYGCTNLASLSFTGWNTSSVRNMSYMFYNCSSLPSTTDFSGLTTASVTNMSYMFYGCTSLTNPSFSSWTTSSVSNMSYMFANSGLINPTFSSWNTSAVTNMSHMFDNCASLTGTGFSSWNTSTVSDMSYMFYNCTSLINPTFSSWTISNLRNASYMFYGCTSLTTSDFSSWAPTLSYTQFMFYGCSSIESLDISGFNTSSATNMGDMFTGCSSLRSITLGENFSFKGTNSGTIASTTSYQALLPTPDDSVSRTQCWILVDSNGNLKDISQPYTPEGLRDNYSGATMAGTYIWDTTMTVRFWENDGTEDYTDLQIIFYDKDQTVSASILSLARDGYTLLGWSWDKDASTAEYEAGSNISVSANAWKSYYFDETGTYATYDSSNNKVILNLYAVWSIDTYTLVIYKYADTDTPLAGAEFTVEAVNASGTILETIATDAPTDDSGEITLSGLEQDTIYKITETKPPSGYNVLVDPIYVMFSYDASEGDLVGYLVDADGNTKTDAEGTGIELTKLDDGNFQIKILNTQIESMPLTGFTGSGTLYIFASGIALMALAAYALYRQRTGRGMSACASHVVAPYQAHASRPHASHAVASPWQARAASRPQPTRRRTH